MNRLPPSRNHLLGLGLDGSGIGPDGEDGQTRVTRGEDYLLVGGSEPVHEHLQELAETISDACRHEGTTLGAAPAELLGEILSDLEAAQRDEADDHA